MGDTGYKKATWVTLQDAVTLTQGGTTENLSVALSLDVKSGCILSVDADYSNHAKATGGLFVYVCGDINGTDYEVEADNPWGFEMVFTQDGTNRRPFLIDGSAYDDCKVLLDWDNSTGSSAVTVTTKYKLITVPVAS